MFQLKIDRLASAGDAIHIIDKTIKRNKEFDDDKAKEADNRRMKSLKNMKNVYDQQKLAIKNALKVNTNTGKSKKIIFSDNDDDDSKPVNGNQIKSKLFNDDDDDDEDNFDSKFAVREEYQGVRGAKLQQLNARYNADGRFQMDASFLPEDNNDDATMTDNHVPKTDKNNEREWQYEILEGIIGHELHSKNTTAIKDKNRLPQIMMQRYDPTKSEHTKFLAKTKQKQMIENQDDGTTATPIVTDDTGIKVSKEQFYKTAELSSSLWSKSTGFSLLNMFGQSNNEDNTKNNEILPEFFNKKNTTKLMNDMTNPFEYDSSDDDEQFLSNSIKKKLPATTTSTKTIVPKKISETKKSKMNKVPHERFFFTADDDRLKGSFFFC